MIEKTVGAHGIDRARVFITGLSAGGAMTAAMLAVYPEVFAAGAVIARSPAITPIRNARMSVVMSLFPVISSLG